MIWKIKLRLPSRDDVLSLAVIFLLADKALIFQGNQLSERHFDVFRWRLISGWRSLCAAFSRAAAGGLDQFGDEPPLIWRTRKLKVK
jgi:hypothetical protein